MTIWRQLAICLCLVITGYAAPLKAACELPAEVRRSAQAAARYLMREEEIVGIASVLERGTPDGERPELLDVLVPFKGPSGRITLQRYRQGNLIEITNASVSLNLPAGTLGFVAVRRSRGSFLISECTSALIGLHRQADLIRESYRIAQQR